VPPASRERAHIASLDGLRGIAALYVVVHHAHRLCLGADGSDTTLPRSLARWLKIFTYGRCAVVLFIVLSGFVLMLPLVQSPDHRLRGGFKDYLKRRARRILPPYYGALLLTLLLIAVQPLALYQPDGQLTLGSVVSHLLLVQNLVAAWNHAINTPMWSVATEWDLYFLFPLLLLPVWRRFGIKALLATAAAAAIIPQLFGRPALDWAAPWFILLFALGMSGAIIACDPGLTVSGQDRLRRWSGWCTILLVPPFLICYALKGFIYPHWRVGYELGTDIAFGLDAACLIVFCATQPRSAEQQAGQRTAWIVRLAQSPPSLTLGRFSYSLYLVHWPMLALARGWMQRQGLGINATVALMFLMTIPTTAVAYVFYLVFEKPFMAKKKKSPIRTTAGSASRGENMPPALAIGSRDLRT
jgi:peptidoglycan/LPS O-acetylase OafA/YrhL